MLINLKSTGRIDDKRRNILSLTKYIKYKVKKRSGSRANFKADKLYANFL